MHLYYVPPACSLAVNIALHEAGLDYAKTRVDLATHTTEHGEDFYAIHAKGYVPYLKLDDGSGLGEVAAILQYVGDRNPAAGLVPAAGTPARYRLQEWLAFISSEVHKPIGGLFDRSMHPDTRAASLKKIEGRLDLVTRLFEGRDWALAEGYSVADGYLYTVINWLRLLKQDEILASRPEITAFLARVESRPKVQEALKAVGLAGG